MLKLTHCNVIIISAIDIRSTPVSTLETLSNCKNITQTFQNVFGHHKSLIHKIFLTYLSSQAKPFIFV